MAKKKAAAKTTSKTRRHTGKIFTIPELLRKFQAEASKHVSVVKRIRTALDRNASIILAHDTTEK